MRHTGSALAVSLGTAALLGLGACERAPAGPPVTMSISGDSIIEMDRDTLTDGSPSTACEFDLVANIEGPDGEHAIVRGGRVDYVWWETGNPATSYEWSPQLAHRFWADTLLPAGASRLSQRHGFGQSEPARPVRGTVTFRYAASNGDAEVETEPFRFYCY